MAENDPLAGLGDLSLDDVFNPKPVPPPTPGPLDRLSSILGNTIGLPKKGADALANAVADQIIGPGAHMSEGEMLSNALIPEDTSDHSYARTLGRAGISTLGDILTDPLVEATMGAEAVPEAAGALKFLNPAFTASMGLGAAETVPGAVKGLATQGLNPDTAAQALQAGINLGGFGWGLKGAYEHYQSAPATGPDAMLQDGLHQLVTQGKMSVEQANETFAKAKNPDLVQQEAQTNVAARPAPQPGIEQFQPGEVIGENGPELPPQPTPQANISETQAPPTEQIAPEQPNAAQPVEAAPAPLPAEPVQEAAPVEPAEAAQPPAPLAPPVQAQIEIPSEPPSAELPPEMEQVLAQTTNQATPDLEVQQPAPPIRMALPEPEAPAEAAPQAIPEAPPTPAPVEKPVPEKISVDTAKQAILALPDSGAKTILLKSEKTPHVFEIIYNSLNTKGEFPRVADIVADLKGRGQGLTQAHIGVVRRAIADSGLLKDFGIEGSEHLPKQGKRASVRDAEKAARNNARAAEQQRLASEQPPLSPAPPEFDAAFQKKFGEPFDQSKPEHIAKAQGLVDELLPKEQSARGIVRQQADKKAASLEEAQRIVQEERNAKALPDEPPLKAGDVRLYRGMQPEGAEQEGRRFTTNPQYAKAWAKEYGGQVHYVDVPQDVFSDPNLRGEFKMEPFSGKVVDFPDIGRATEVLVPPDVAKEAQLHPSEEGTVQDINHKEATLLDVKQADPREMVARLSDPANTEELLKLADIVESRVRGFDQEAFKGKDAQAKLAEAVVHEIQRKSFDPHLQSRTRLEAQVEEGAQESPLAALPKEGYSVSTTGGKPWEKTLAEAKENVKKALTGEKTSPSKKVPLSATEQQILDWAKSSDAADMGADLSERLSNMVDRVREQEQGSVGGSSKWFSKDIAKLERKVRAALGNERGALDLRGVPEPPLPRRGLEDDMGGTRKTAFDYDLRSVDGDAGAIQVEPETTPGKWDANGEPVLSHWSVTDTGEFLDTFDTEAEALKYAERVRQERYDEMAQQGHVKLGVLNPAWIPDAIKVGYEYFRKGLTDTYLFGKKLVSEFGSKIEPYVRHIYNEASALYKKFQGKTGFSFGELEKEPSGETLGTMGGALQQVLNPRRLPKPNTAAENVKTAGEATRAEVDQAKSELENRQGPMDERGKPAPRNAKEVENLLNVSKASDDPQVRQESQRLIEAAQDVFARAKGKARPWDEVKEKATKIGLTPEEAARLYKASNGTLNDAEMVHYKQLSEAATKELVRTGERVKSLKEQGKDTELAEIAHNAALQQAIGVHAAYIGAGAEGARALGIRRALLESMNEGDYLLGRIKRIYKGLTPDMEAQIKAAIDTGDKGALIEAIRKANNPTAFKAFMEWWKSWGLLSGPPTHVANWIGNRLMREIKYWDQGVASGLDALHTKLTGKERQIFTEEYGAMKFGAAQIKSTAAKRLFSALNDAIQGNAPSARELFEGSKIDNPGVVGGRLGEYNRIWFKFLEAADSYHKGIAGGEELYRQAYRLARKSGLKGGEAWDKMREIANSYVKEEDAITSGELQGHTEQFYNLAQKVEWARKHYTFQDNLGKVGQGIQAILQEYPALGFVFPFVKTPINIAKRTVEHTPVEAFKAYYKFRRGQLSHTELTEQMAKAVVGTTIAGAVYTMANQGLFTGGGPTDPRMQQAKKESGWQPYSVKLGGQYISYQRFEPLSSILGMASDASELINSGDVKGFGDAMEKVVGSITENLTSKTFLSGLESLSTALHDPRRYAGRFAKQLEASLVPNIVGKVAQAIDPTYRKTELGDLSPLQAKIPGLSQELPPQLSPTGEERQRPGSAVERFISPATRQAEDQPRAALNKEFARVGFVPSLTKDYLSPMGKKVQLLPDESLLLNKAQKAASDAATRLISGAEYQSLPDNDESAPIGQRMTKQKMLENVYSRYRKQAQDQIMPAVLRRMQEQYGKR